MEFKIKKSKAIMSHLSDIQEMISFGDANCANLRINFVKMLIQDERTDMSVEELNEVWKKCVDTYA